MRSSEAAAGVLRGKRLRVVVGLLAVVLFAAFAVSAATGAQRAAAGPVFKVTGSWGGFGTEASLAVGGDGTVYVADSNLNLIKGFSSTGEFLTQFAFEQAGTVPDVAVGPDGDVWGTTDVTGLVARFHESGGLPGGVATPKAARGIGVDADGNVYVSTYGDQLTGELVLFASQPTGAVALIPTLFATGLQFPGDVEVSRDGSIYVAERMGSPPSVKRFDASGRVMNTIKLRMQPTADTGVTYGIAVDPDCNVWATNPEQRNMTKYSPTGKLLGTATSGDLVGTDVAVGPKGDLYVFDVNTQSVIRFAEVRSKPARARVSGSDAFALDPPLAWRWHAKYTAAGIACPSVIQATASLRGIGAARALRASAPVEVEAGKTTEIEIPLPDSVLLKLMGKTVSANFKIVLETNGRRTTQTARVRFHVPYYTQ